MDFHGSESAHRKPGEISVTGYSFTNSGREALPPIARPGSESVPVRANPCPVVLLQHAGHGVALIAFSSASC